MPRSLQIAGLALLIVVAVVAIGYTLSRGGLGGPEVGRDGPPPGALDRNAKPPANIVPHEPR